jgi:class 3 adenylate cyclase
VKSRCEAFPLNPDLDAGDGCMRGGNVTDLAAPVGRTICEGGDARQGNPPWASARLQCFRGREDLRAPSCCGHPQERMGCPRHRPRRRGLPRQVWPRPRPSARRRSPTRSRCSGWRCGGATGVRLRVDLDRVLATVMFTDIVGSTELLARFGDSRWTEVLAEHRLFVRRELERFRGREVDTAGDGFLATFDGPARAIKCAAAIRDSVGRLGLHLRSGLHTGEVEMRPDGVAGIAVHIAARVAAAADSNEILVSRTVVDLVAGSGIEFADLGGHILKGVPGEWQLFAVADAH